MGLFDSVLNQVKKAAINAGGQVVREKVGEVASKGFQKVEIFTVKQIILANMRKDPEYENVDPETKAHIEQMIESVVNYYINPSDDVNKEELTRDYDFVTNRIYRGLGKPETACNDNLDDAMNEFTTVAHEIVERSKAQQNTTN